MKFYRLLFVLMMPVLFFACSKEKSFEQGAGTATSQWEFTEGSKLFKGRVDTAYLVDLGGTAKGLLFEGTSDDGTGLLGIGISGFNPSSPATYKTPNVQFEYLKSTGVVYENDFSAPDKFTLQVTAIDSASVTAIFNGEVKDSTGAIRTITNGKFKARLKNTTTPPPATTGQVSFWAKNSCTAGGDITVKIENQNGTISTFTPAAPTACGTAGNANFTLPQGTYSWKAFCGGDSLVGNVNITASGCAKVEVAFPTGTAGQYAIVNCGTAQVNGTYIVNKLLGDTNNVVLQVNVTTPGAYIINTTTVNGYSFSASGTFTAPGVTNVTLRGNGTPLATGLNTFTATAGSSTCNFNVTVVNGVVSPALNTWSFTSGTKTYSGTFAGGADFGDDFFGFGKAVDLFGEIPNTDTTFDLYIQFPGTATQPIPGSYVTNPDLFNSNTTDLYMYDTNNDIFYVKDFPPLPPTTPTLTIVISSYDAGTKVIKGTFSGQAWNTAGTIVNITNGKFEALVNF